MMMLLVIVIMPMPMIAMFMRFTALVCVYVISHTNKSLTLIMPLPSMISDNY